MTRIAIVQSNYLPWFGYFQLIKMVDKFVLFDNVQYTERDWRNRNRIKTAQGTTWLTIPIENNSLRGRLICEIEAKGKEWGESHLEIIRRNYSRARFFDEVFPVVTDLFGKFKKLSMLTEINEVSINYISELLSIRTKILPARYKLPPELDANDKLIYICKKENASFYLSGPKAKSYLNVEKFRSNAVQFGFIEYASLEYPQPWGNFVSNLSIIDVLFNLGIEHTREKLK